MINEWKKVVNAKMIFNSFDWGVYAVSLPLGTSSFSAKRHFHMRLNAHRDHGTLRRNLPLYVLKIRICSKERSKICPEQATRLIKT